MKWQSEEEQKGVSSSQAVAMSSEDVLFEGVLKLFTNKNDVER